MLSFHSIYLLGFTYNVIVPISSIYSMRSKEKDPLYHRKIITRACRINYRTPSASIILKDSACMP